MTMFEEAIKLSNLCYHSVLSLGNFLCYDSHAGVNFMYHFFYILSDAILKLHHLKHSTAVIIIGMCCYGVPAFVKVVCPLLSCLFCMCVCNSCWAKLIK